ncbi:MAG: serine acetyltransferase [Desulfobacteraceae bacterium]|nr:serine acetyltransferase [Desulfobacteraceae bacterium]
MDNTDLEFESSHGEAKPKHSLTGDIALAVERLMASNRKEAFFDHGAPRPVPSQGSIIEVIKQAKRIIFPGHVAQIGSDPGSLEHTLGHETEGLLKNLSEQITLAIQYGGLTPDRSVLRRAQTGYEIARRFIGALPELRAVLVTDVRAALEGDPAAKSYDEIIFCYPGLLALTVYRMAHELHEMNVPLLPRMMTEYAHSLTGIDIHPGAKIGKSFFIDHGTGVVVGETTEIGDRVRIYQGVTLGALSIPRDDVGHFRDKKRHPTIEDDVIIYSNATILGGKTVIGARSVIGGNVWIIESVPPDTKVLLKKPELMYIGNGTGSDPKEGSPVG